LPIKGYFNEAMEMALKPSVICTSLKDLISAVSKKKADLIFSRDSQMPPRSLMIALEMAGLLACAVTDDGDVKFWARTVYKFENLYELQASFLESIGLRDRSKVTKVMALFGLALATGSKFCPGVQNYSTEQLLQDAKLVLHDETLSNNIEDVLQKYIPKSTILEQYEIVAAVRAILDPPA